MSSDSLARRVSGARAPFKFHPLLHFHFPSLLFIETSILRRLSLRRAWPCAWAWVGLLPCLSIPHSSLLTDDCPGRKRVVRFRLALRMTKARRSFRPLLWPFHWSHPLSAVYISKPRPRDPCEARPSIQSSMWRRLQHNPSPLSITHLTVYFIRSRHHIRATLRAPPPSIPLEQARAHRTPRPDLIPRVKLSVTPCAWRIVCHSADPPRAMPRRASARPRLALARRGSRPEHPPLLHPLPSGWRVRARPSTIH